MIVVLVRVRPRHGLRGVGVGGEAGKSVFTAGRMVRVVEVLVEIGMAARMGVRVRPTMFSFDLRGGSSEEVDVERPLHPIGTTRTAVVPCAPLVT